MRRRFDLTDLEWSVIQPLLPNTSRGVPRADERRVTNGILWRFRTRSPWAAILFLFLAAEYLTRSEFLS